MGRWVIDPALIGASTVLPIANGVALRADPGCGGAAHRPGRRPDRRGADGRDLINEAKNRIVCDNNQVLQNPNVAHAPCVNASATPARAEAGPPAALADVNTAYDLGGAVHDNYAAFRPAST